MFRLALLKLNMTSCFGLGLLGIESIAGIWLGTSWAGVMA